MLTPKQQQEIRADLDAIQQQFLAANDVATVLCLLHEAYQRGYSTGTSHLSTVISDSMDLATAEGTLQ